jgi:hypothetical protein
LIIFPDKYFSQVDLNQFGNRMVVQVTRLVKDAVDFASLSAVLKNSTRRKIILHISDKGSISYVDLMNSIEITNTGKFNYHLKILGDLLEKDENGKYNLSEKGRVALQFLQMSNVTENKETVFKTRAFSLFAGLIWFLSVYLFLPLMFGWYLYFADPTITAEGGSITQLITLSIILIPAFVLITINQFPIIEIDNDSIAVKWATGSSLFIMEEVKIDVNSHILRLGERLIPFGWFIPFEEDECFNLLSKHVERYKSKALYLTFVLPPTLLTFMFVFTNRLESVFSPDLWAIFWGVTIAISLAMFTYSFPAEINLRKMNRGLSSIIFGVVVGVIIAVSLFIGYHFF